MVNKQSSTAKTQHLSHTTSSSVEANRPLLRIFIGYDSREPVAYHVLSHSLLRQTTEPIAIIPLARQSLTRSYTRKRGPTEATEFSMTRFLVPYLSDYEGYSVFMDCDMLVKVDIQELWLHILANPDKAVLVCQHDYTPKSDVKFLDQQQTVYPRKNWSSMMVFNNRKCKMLTPDYVNTATGLELHRLVWLNHDQIGSLPLEWNWLVGEYNENPQAKVLHFTNGGPWFPEYRDSDHAADWLTEKSLLGV